MQEIHPNKSGKAGASPKPLSCRANSHKGDDIQIRSTICEGLVITVGFDKLAWRHTVHRGAANSLAPQDVAFTSHRCNGLWGVATNNAGLLWLDRRLHGAPRLRDHRSTPGRRPAGER